MSSKNSKSKLIFQELGDSKKTAEIDLAKITELKSLEEWKVKYLGRKSFLTNILRDIKNYDPKERPIIGSEANNIRKSLENSFENKNKELKNKIQKLIPDSLFPEHESNLSSPALVTCLGKRLDFAVSIDNGIMHMLSLAKIPMISLFGPTDSEKFAPEYNNSISLDSKKLYNTKNLSAITVKDVLNAAKQLLNY